MESLVRHERRQFPLHTFSICYETPPCHTIWSLAACMSPVGPLSSSQPRAPLPSFEIAVYTTTPYAYYGALFTTGFNLVEVLSRFFVHISITALRNLWLTWPLERRRLRVVRSPHHTTIRLGFGYGFARLAMAKNNFPFSIYTYKRICVLYALRLLCTDTATIQRPTMVSPSLSLCYPQLHISDDIRVQCTQLNRNTYKSGLVYIALVDLQKKLVHNFSTNVTQLASKKAFGVIPPRLQLSIFVVRSLTSFIRLYHPKFHVAHLPLSSIQQSNRQLNGGIRHKNVEAIQAKR